MSSFIVIGTQTKLGWLTDGIAGCRPLNPSVVTNISTGKLEDKDGKLYYTYPANNAVNSEDASTLAECMKNHISSFRRAANKKDLLNIFLLENPMSEEELEDLRTWNEEIEKVYAWDKGVHFYRILLAYDLRVPTDVTRQIPLEIGTDYLQDIRSLSLSDRIPLNVMILGNRDKSGASVSLKKDEHDFKLPRILSDLMMLLSDNTSKYNIFNAIKSETNCFSIGYAESMYYFPDVEEYYRHADMRDLYLSILKDEDEASDVDDNESLDAELYPIGLYARRRRLETYADIPFDKNLYDDKYKESADYKIEECMNRLKDALQRSPDGCCFENRKEIYRHSLGLLKGEKRDEYLCVARDNYKKIVEYARSDDFYEFVKKGTAPERVNTSTVKKISLWVRIAKLFTRKREKASSDTENMERLTNVIDCLRVQCSLKEVYKSFTEKIEEIELDKETEEKFCKEFRLKDHMQHYYHLIDLDKLRTTQQNSFDARYKNVKTTLRNENNKTLCRLKQLMQETTKRHVKQFEFIVWFKATPAFVADTSDNCLTGICNNLYDKSTPFVHYDVITKRATNNITLALYSDMSGFNKMWGAIRGNVTNGNLMSAYVSRHIASKICLFQFLPLNKIHLDAIIKENGKDDILTTGCAKEEPEQTKQ